MPKLITINGREIHSDYNLWDWIKVLGITLLSLSFLVYGILFYVDSFLIPGLEGFTLTLEITSDWLELEAENHAEQVLAEPPEDTSELIQEIQTKQEIISNTANNILIGWISMAMGLFVPFWIIWKINNGIRFLGWRFFSVEESKRMIYVIDRR